MLGYIDFENIFMESLENHAPLKKKVIRANQATYMTKTLMKAIMKRSNIENKLYKNPFTENNKAYRKHKFFCRKLYKK